MDKEESGNQTPAEIEIIEYSDEMAAAFAEMFNSWDDLWPGGYTQSVPYTEDRVKSLYGKMSAIALLFAVDSATGRPIGMCTLHNHWRDSDAAYIGTLGVSPEALNKKVGKRLLLEAIKIVTANGKTRVDLNTWPGNMRAVPLYKKVGLMWNPTGDGVQMEDYIPSILNHPLNRSFFGKLSTEQSWYDIHVRDIAQAPDVFSEDGMDVFPYRFENGDDYLSIVVDKHSRYITSIEQSINGSLLKVAARISNHTVLCGVPTEYILEIENKSNEEMEVPIKIDGFKGLEFSTASSTTLKISGNDKVSWTVPFVLGPESPVHRQNMKTPSIKAELKINGEKCYLKTGLVIKPIAEVRTRLDEIRISSGGQTPISLSLLSASKEKWFGTVHIESSSKHLRITPAESSIELPPEGFAGVTLTAKADRELVPGTHDIWVYMTLSNNGNQITTRKFRVAVYCLDNGTIAIGQIDRLRRKTAVSHNYFATFEDEGAILRIRNAAGTRMGSFMIRTQIGPPFGIDTFRFAPRKFENKEVNGDQVLSMKAEHPERPILVEDRATFEKGTGVVVHELWVTNTGKESHTLQARIYGSGGGISLNSGTVWLPMKDGVIEEPIGEGYLSYPALPGNPDAFSEGWLAATTENGVKGQFWDLREVEEVRVGMGQLISLYYPSVTIEAGETRRLTRVWMATSITDWTEVRRLYQARVLREQHTYIPEEKTKSRPAFAFDISPLVLSSVKERNIDVTARKAIVAPMPVNLAVEAPRGWSAELHPAEDSEEDRVDLTRLSSHMIQDQESLSVKVFPSRDIEDRFAIYSGSINMRLTSSRKTPFHIVQLGSSGNEVVVDESEDEGLKVFTVRNGLTEFKISADYGGCMYSLKNSRGTELLISTFPTAEPKPGGFLQNYFGGIQPVIWDDAFNEDLTSAMTNREKMKAKVIEDGIWKGVEVSWIGRVQVTTRGVKFKLQYLTAPGSPLIITRWIVDNATSSPVSFYPSLYVDSGFDGDTSQMVYRTEWEGRVTDISSQQVPTVPIPSSNTLWVRKGESDINSEGLGLISHGSLPGLMGIFLGQFLFMGTLNLTVKLQPGEKRETINCFLVDPEKQEDMIVLQSILTDLV